MSSRETSETCVGVMTALLASRDEPEQWASRDNPTSSFIVNPTNLLEEKRNLQKYLDGFPWIIKIRDASRYLAYHCGLCNRAAKPGHLTSSHHNKRATSVFPWCGSSPSPLPTVDESLECA